MNLIDRVAFVTGGGRALGKCIALQLARDGADVCVVGPEAEELEVVAGEIRALGRNACNVITDVRNEQQIESAVSKARDALGRIDILVNNAGIIGPTAPVQDVTREQWDETLAVNLTGAFLCAKAIAPEMIERGSGTIVNISSIAGRIGYALRAPYCASKWGLIGLTLTLAKELGSHNVQVNAICPGPIDSGRMQKVIQQKADELGESFDDVRQEYLDTTLLGRMVREEDIAAMVAYLCSDAGNNITGQAIDVTAGYGL